MRKKYIFGRKLYISILTMIVVLLTTVATTFAWVGVFANSTFDTFDFKIKSSSLEEYGVVISATGEENTFSDSIPAVEIKRQILRNWGYSKVATQNDETVEILFSKLNLDQCTNTPILNNNKIQKMGIFKSIEQFDTKHYFKFDIYIAATQFYEGSTDASTFLMDVFIGNNLLYGTNRRFELDASHTFDDSFVNPLVNLPDGIKKITGGDTISSAYVNAASAARVAFEKYEVVDLGHPELYTSSSEPISSVIYSGDKYDYPTYNENNGVYEFGGILPNEYNMAVINYNRFDFIHQKNGINSVAIPSSIYNIRGVGQSNPDLILSSTTNHLIDSSNTNEQISLNKMMKVTVTMWIEGWDADCFNVINNSPITLNVTLSLSNEFEF